MSRLSRRAKLLRWMLPFFIALFLAMWTLSFYVFFMNRRISRELATHSWREPTTIVSAANGKSREILRVYGSGWRVTRESYGEAPRRRKDEEQIRPIGRGRTGRAACRRPRRRA